MKTPDENKQIHSSKRTKARFAWVSAACCLLIALTVLVVVPRASQDATVQATAALQNAHDVTSVSAASSLELPGQHSESGRNGNDPAAEFPEHVIDQPVISDGEDGIAAEHEAGVVLVKLPEGVSADDVNETIAQFDFLASQTVSSDDTVLGWTELSLAEGANVPDAVAALQTSGLVEAAQPNYVYRLIDDRFSEELTTENARRGELQLARPTEAGSQEVVGSGADLQPGQVSGDFPPLTEPTGESYDTRDYFTFVDDGLANNQTALFTVKLEEAYNYLFGLGLVSEAGVGKGKGPVTWASWNGDANAAVRPTVAVIDTGCNIQHPDLKNNIVAPYDVVVPDQAFTDIDGHGTHVCGIVAAEMNNRLGVVGVSFNARIMPVQVFRITPNDFSADSKDIARGYEYVLDHASEYNVRVVNLSLGANTEKADSDDKLFLEAIDKAYRQNILTVIASGNDGYNGAYTDFPADFTPNAVSVIDCTIANVTADENARWGIIITQARVDYSNFNKAGTVTKQVCALGDYVLSTVRSGYYNTKSGTSMAAPCVAGLAALALQVNPDLDVEQLRSLLYSTSDDVATSPGREGYDDAVAPGFDVYTGFGTVNAYRVAKAAREGRYLSVVEGGATTVPVLATGTTANTVKLAAPADATDVVWESSATGVAEVADGLVTAKGAGQAIISASYTVPGVDEAPAEPIVLYTTVTVVEPTITGSSIVAYNGATDLEVDADTLAGAWRWSSNNGNVSVGEWTGTVKGEVPNSSAVITATLDSNPAIQVSKTVTVGRIDLTDAAISLDCLVYTYDGNEKRPNVTKVQVGGKDVPASAYTVSYANNKAAGTATVRVSAKTSGDYTNQATKTFTINPMSVADDSNVTISLTQTSYTVDGTAKEPAVTVKAKIGGNWKTLAKGTDYTVKYSDNVKAGTAKVTVTGKGNFTGTVTKTFTIRAAATPAPTPATPSTPSPPSTPAAPQPSTPAVPSTPATPSAPAPSSAPEQPSATEQPSVPEQPSTTVVAEGPKRLSGDVALDTMRAIVTEGWSGVSGGAVVLTTADGYWDALTAAGVAGMAQAPVLMTDIYSLSAQTETTIRELAPTTIVVCGGEAAVSDAVAQAAANVAGGARIVRCWGLTATGTAVDAFNRASSEGMGTWSSTAFVCTNDGYWDALAAAPISYAKAMPIFLTEGAYGISDETLAAMSAGGVTSVYIVGGAAAVDDAVADTIRAAGIDVADRLAGDTAVETSERVAEFGLARGLGCTKMGIATTNGYWDALAGAPLCGLNDSVLVLAGDASSHSIAGFVQSHKAQVGICYVFGGEAALDAATYQALQDAVG